MTEQEQPFTQSALASSSSLVLSIPLGVVADKMDRKDNVRLSFEGDEEAQGEKLAPVKATGLLERPVVSIDLRRLVGYPPKSQDVVDSIQQQLIEAMWTRYRQDYGDNNEDDVYENEIHQESKEYIIAASHSSSSSFPRVPPDFDSQIQELLDAKLAQFGVVGSSKHFDDNEIDNTTNSTTTTAKFNFCTLEYPPRIRNPFAVNKKSPSSSSSEDDAWLDTAQAWREIQRLSTEGASFLQLPPLENDSEKEATSLVSRTIPPKESLRTFEFLDKLTQHLVATSRTLTWKHAMALELQQCMKQELLFQQHQDWINTQRQAKLDSLYGVRETLVLQTELAKEHYQKLCNKRDEKVTGELFQQFREGTGSSGNYAAAFGNLTASDPTELDLVEEFQRMGILPQMRDALQDEWDDDDMDKSADDDYFLEDSSLDEDCIDSENDDDDDNESSSISCGSVASAEATQDYDANAGGNNHTADSILLSGSIIEAEPVDSSAVDQLPPPTLERSSKHTLSIPFQKRQERRRKAKQRKRKEKIQTEKQAKREQLEAAAKELQARYTTREMILVQTKLQAFEQKVKHVDQLLESLQDEVWEAEESEEAEQERYESNETNKADDSIENAPPISLLDQVLAMILGALPAHPSRTAREQFEYVKQEHDAIVAGWKDYFGRLPPPAISAEKRNIKMFTGSGESMDITRTDQPSLTPAEQRAALGILDNEDGEWDEDDKEN